MNVLESLLQAVIAEPLDGDHWHVLGDWLEEHDDPRRAELFHLHRRLLVTCSEPERHVGRAEWHTRISELLQQGVSPCVPQWTVPLGEGVAMTFSWIPPGTFLRGSPPGEQERSPDEVLHRVTITKGFWMGVHPVTQAQWRMVMGRNPSRFAEKDDHPVEAVSWDDCREFCARLSRKGGQHFRLPTEAEWEYVCRAGTTTPFCFGETISAEQANYNDQHTEEQGGTGGSLGRTTAVGSFPLNPWGLYDLHGNVWEWCQDWYGPYPPGEQKDPMGSADGIARVVRGGSWLGGARLCRSACRIKFAPENRFGYIGCRVCLSPD
jgi:uncharacterized protein (TIGR02996 family)